MLCCAYACNSIKLKQHNIISGSYMPIYYTLVLKLGFLLVKTRHEPRQKKANIARQY